MSRVIMGCAAVSADGFIADESDGVGSLFDWLGNGDVEWARVVDLAAGQIGGQALRLGLVDQVVMNVVPVVFGSGRPFFGPGDPVRLDDPSRVAQGDRVTHLLYDVSRPAA
ncbi:hypothetical protein AB0M20_16410 [Actinoplanes sp. NPDC051633]|uniref:hypothetical protein n=1 Tax=Actinoplanes sp. NPDC051633 TaxID=3155670 RepID=UPI003443A7E3